MAHSIHSTVIFDSSLKTTAMFTFTPASTKPMGILRLITRNLYKVVMVRHGESEWNAKNLFTGWYDTKLSPQGEKEAEKAGETLKREKYHFDLAFCSVLTRAIQTLHAILKKLHQTDLKTIHSWRLNERHYGSLTGLNKEETAKKYGEEQVKIWRRSYDVPPPFMKEDHPHYDHIVKDPRYKGDPKLSEFPMGESLKMTLERTLPFWQAKIIPEVKAGRQVLIAAHGNSLRGIVKSLDDMTDEQIMGVNLPTGIPFVYILGNDMKPIPNGSMKFLGDPETVEKAIASVSKQGKINKK